MYHYTWGVNLLDPSDGFKTVWSWDKRAYTAAQHSFKVPPLPMPPAVDEIVAKGLMQHYPQKKRMTRELAETFHQMLGAPDTSPSGAAAWFHPPVVLLDFGSITCARQTNFCPGRGLTQAS